MRRSKAECAAVAVSETAKLCNDGAFFGICYTGSFLLAIVTHHIGD